RACSPSGANWNGNPCWSCSTSPRQLSRRPTGAKWSFPTMTAQATAAGWSPLKQWSCGKTRRMVMEKAAKRNIYTFGLGTVGRDMVYAMVSMYLMFYLTDVLTVPSATLWALNGIILVGRIFDALNDPIMGVIVDNTNTKYGKFKPWIVLGALTSGIITILLFPDFGLKG